ncbi:MAG: aminopeptidase P family protein [Pegethrix bostrychoides GSE-TBD4-15B]|uniref:Xaa-Pro aminopeptidase n=1 Tax=Pegethrix bostrychoides GSE-TBD4-15B TaxID=2839662 RepID=A0A951PA51_9CYAN|nr:aminopeptidase P family protein [Pegethrix bostrychoides GSE-TBD4-15B]
MQLSNPPGRPTLADTLRQRRQRLAERVQFPVALWSGRSASRNFPANVHPFRASSHFLYFAGLPIANAAVRLEAGRLELFMDAATAADRLWHGEATGRDQVAAAIGAAAAYPLSHLADRLDGAATIPVMETATRQQQAAWLKRELPAAKALQAIDQQLASAIVELRLIHDELAIAEMRRAAAVTVKAHRAGMQATLGTTTEAEIRAAMEAVITAHNMSTAYSSIVTVQGEVLHNNAYDHAIQPGDLLLADVGAETESGWASDVTRSWPATGRFSPTQRDIYDLVLAAHDACIQAAQPGIEYRDLHLTAAQVLAAGLVDLDILRGTVEQLVEQDAHALFFPHGIGHLLGLDVHDMEDLGDLAGYAAGRSRSERFGLGYLRLDRPLQAGMVVTIEPGFYQVPALLHDPERRRQYQDQVNWERLAQFADLRGIRIEDDVLITPTGAEILTQDLPTAADQIEALVSGD